MNIHHTSEKRKKPYRRKTAQMTLIHMVWQQHLLGEFEIHSQQWLLSVLKVTTSVASKWSKAVLRWANSDLIPIPHWSPLLNGQRDSDYIASKETAGEVLAEIVELWIQRCMVHKSSNNRDSNESQPKDTVGWHKVVGVPKVWSWSFTKYGLIHSGWSHFTPESCTCLLLL